MSGLTKISGGLASDHVPFNRMAEAVEWADGLMTVIYARRWFSWNANTHIEFLERLARLVYEAESSERGLTK